MNKKLAETKFLFDKIGRIYPTFVKPDEFDVECWTEILEGYSQEEILSALKAYRKTVEYNTPPTPASFSKFLHQENGTPAGKFIEYTIWDVDPARGYYEQDVATKPSEEVHALVFYRWALNDIIAEMVDTLPNADKMSFGQKVAIVRRNGWDETIGDRVEEYAREAVKSSGTVDQAISNIVASWRS